MHPIPPEAERSVRRSRLRLKVLITLSSLGEAYVGQLARAVGAQPARVRAALTGREPDYRPDLSLVATGLATELQHDHGTHFRITTKGRRKARSITSAWTRGNRQRL